MTDHDVPRTWFCLAPHCRWSSDDLADVQPHLMGHTPADFIVAMVLHLLVMGIVVHHIRRGEQ